MVRPPRALSQNVFICLALLAALFAVYAQAGHFEFLNLDDDEYVVRNPHIPQGLTAGSIAWALRSTDSAYWFPITRLSYLLDAQLHGLTPGGFHVTNLLLHIACALLLFACFRRMTGTLWQSAFVAFAFALHPTHVETVAWVAERKELLSALFWFLTLWMYLVYVGRPRLWPYCAMAGLFSCGLMSQALIVTLPFALLLLDYWPLKRLREGSRVVLEKLPLIALAIGASAITVVAQQRVGALAELQHLSLSARLENAVVSYVVYIEKFLWPANLAVFYPYSESPAWQWTLAGLTIIAVTVFCIRWRDRRPYLLVGWLWFLGTLVPVIGLVQAGSQSRADRYTYISTIGLSVMVAWSAAEIGSLQRPIAACAVAVALLWCAVSWRTLANWQNSETLFTHALQVTDQNFIAYNNLGTVLRGQGRFEDAVANFENAVRIQPASQEAQDNLGEALTTLGKGEDAIPHLQTAIRLRPDLAKPRIDLGSALMVAGRTEEAAAQFREALRLEPQSSDAEYRLAGVLVVQGHVPEAMPHFEKALPSLRDAVARNPEDADGHYNLGEVYGMMGRPDEAVPEFTAAVRLRPDDADAHFNLGVALSSAGQFDAAAGHFGTAVRLRPDYVNAHLLLARTLAALGRRNDAIEEYSQTLRLAPAMQQARNELDSLTRTR
jgi:tetratricopeptide (TPR) repeat protein